MASDDESYLRLKSKASTGLDLSPGDEDCVWAAKTIDQLKEDLREAKLALGNANREASENREAYQNEYKNHQQTFKDRDKIKETMTDLVAHMWIHSAYKLCGFWEASTKQKNVLIETLKEAGMPDTAESLRIEMEKS